MVSQQGAQCRDGWTNHWQRWRAARALGCGLLLALVACGVDGPPPGPGAEGAAPDGPDPAAAPEASGATSLPADRAAYIAAVQSGASAEYDLARSADGASVVGLCAAQGLSMEMAQGELRLALPAAAESGGEWLALRWTAMGRGAAIEPVSWPEDGAAVRGNRVSWRRADGSVEWYLNGPLGIEQGFVLATRPLAASTAATAEPIRLELAVTGSVEPELAGFPTKPSATTEHAAISARLGSGAALRYSDVHVSDADGTPLRSWLEIAPARIAIVIEDAAARYPIHIDPLIWLQQAQLLAEDANDDDALGSAVSLSGDTALVGASGEGSAWPEPSEPIQRGAAYVFVRSAASWTQQDKLLADDGAAQDSFGWHVSLSGDTALVGADGDDGGGVAKGAAYVFVRSGANWTQQAKLTAVDGVEESEFGSTVSLSGDTALIGAWREDTLAPSSAGAAYVFVREAEAWSEQAKLTASDAQQSDNFGSYVALSGETALVGASADDDQGDHSGSAYVFVRSAETWSQQAKLTASGDATNFHFGNNLSLSGDTALIGAHGDQHGAAYVFVREAEAWSEQARLIASDGELAHGFGSAVAIADDRALVHALGDEELVGAVYLFERLGESWTQQTKLTAPDGKANDIFGASVALSSELALIGAPGSADKRAGSAYVFAPYGQPCAQPTECAHGYCVDGMCCSTPCGGGDPHDCQACSVASGSSTDGRCEQVADGTECHDGVFCNGAETCSAGTCAGSAGDPCAGNVGDGDGDCSESCDEDADECSAPDPDGTECAADGSCSGGICVGPPGAPCTDDPECSTGHCLDGVCCQVDTCGAYRCGPDGVCRESCASAADCAPGFGCTADGRCEPLADPDAEGCGCSVVGRGGTRGALLWLALLAVVACPATRRGLRLP